MMNVVAVYMGNWPTIEIDEGNAGAMQRKIYRVTGNYIEVTWYIDRHRKGERRKIQMHRRLPVSSARAALIQKIWAARKP